MINQDYAAMCSMFIHSKGMITAHDIVNDDLSNC